MFIMKPTILFLIAHEPLQKKHKKKGEFFPQNPIFHDQNFFKLFGRKK